MIEGEETTASSPLSRSSDFLTQSSGRNDLSTTRVIKMSLHPAKQRALDYVRRKGTEASLDSLKDRLRRSFADLEDAIDTLNEETARRRPQEGHWSIQEIVDHLAISHRRGAEQVNALIAGRSPGEAIPAGLQSADPMGKPWPEAVNEIKVVHHDFLALLEQIDENMSLDRTAPVVMLLKVPDEDGALQILEWIEDLDWKAFLLVVPVHNREHLDQIQRTLSAVA